MPVYMILFKVSEINIKPPHNSVCVCVCVCGGGGVREVMILNSILGLGKMMWKHERAYKGPHRKSLSEPRLKLWLPWSPSRLLTAWSKTCKCPLFTPPHPEHILLHLYPAQKGEFVLLQGKWCIMAEMGKPDVAMQKMWPLAQEGRR